MVYSCDENVDIEAELDALEAEIFREEPVRVFDEASMTDEVPYLLPQEDDLKNDEHCSYFTLDFEKSARQEGTEGAIEKQCVSIVRRKRHTLLPWLMSSASLKAANQQLIQKLQSRASLEAEVSRLKCLLVDTRGRIEGEIGSFPYQKPVKPPNMYQNIPNTNFPSSSNIACNENGKCGQDCEFQNLNCMGGLGSPPSFT
ncbi:uncharacterized protein LOC141632811 [Silene latifolia]|uniref:uncharacterized protein LOC141632811 n=1 Tax=Silene latifolia TaxID=37657 RepID=UPI003D77202D